MPVWSFLRLQDCGHKQATTTCMFVHAQCTWMLRCCSQHLVSSATDTKYRGSISSGGMLQSKLWAEKKEERSFSTDDGRSKLNSSRPFHAIIRKLTYLQTTLLTDYSSKTVAFLDYICTHLMSVCWISSSLRWTCFECSGLSPILPQPTAEVSASRGKRSNFRVNDLYMPRQSLCVILTHDIYFNLARLMQWIEKCAQIHAGFCTLGMSIFLRAYWLHSTRKCRVDYPSWSSLPRQKRARVRAPVSIKHSKSVLPESVTWQH